MKEIIRAQNFSYKVVDCEIRDTFLPPMAIEKRFKVDLEVLGTVKDKKGWLTLYTSVLY